MLEGFHFTDRRLWPLDPYFGRCLQTYRPAITMVAHIHVTHVMHPVCPDLYISYTCTCHPPVLSLRVNQKFRLLPLHFGSCRASGFSRRVHIVYMYVPPAGVVPACKSNISRVHRAGYPTFRVVSCVRYVPTCIYSVHVRVARRSCPCV